MNNNWLDLLNGKSALVAAIAILAISTTYTNYAISNFAPWKFAETSVYEKLHKLGADTLDLKANLIKLTDNHIQLTLIVARQSAEIEQLKTVQSGLLKGEYKTRH